MERHSDGRILPPKLNYIDFLFVYFILQVQEKSII